MAAPNRSSSARITLPSETTQALHYIGRAWVVNDVADAIPYHLHPQGEHCADLWSPQFVAVLKDIAMITHRRELSDIAERLQAAVDIRRNKHPGRKAYLIVKDLESTRRVFRTKRALEKEQEERRQQSVEANAILRAQERVLLQAQEHARLRAEHDETETLQDVTIQNEAP